MFFSNLKNFFPLHEFHVGISCVMKILFLFFMVSNVKTFLILNKYNFNIFSSVPIT